MTTFGSQIVSHIASVVGTEFKAMLRMKAHPWDIFIQICCLTEASFYQLLTRTVKAYGTSSLMNSCTQHSNLMKPLEPF